MLSYRLASFSDCPFSGSIHPCRLAALDFSYCRECRQVICCKCGLGLSDPGADDVLDSHRQVSPRCPSFSTMTVTTLAEDHSEQPTNLLRCVHPLNPPLSPRRGNGVNHDGDMWEQHHLSENQSTDQNLDPPTGPNLPIALSAEAYQPRADFSGIVMYNRSEPENQSTTQNLDPPTGPNLPIALSAEAFQPGADFSGIVVYNRSEPDARPLNWEDFELLLRTFDAYPGPICEKRCLALQGYSYKGHENRVTCSKCGITYRDPEKRGIFCTH